MALLYQKGCPILGRVLKYYHLFSKSFLVRCWADDGEMFSDVHQRKKVIIFCSRVLLFETGCAIIPLAWRHEVRLWCMAYCQIFHVIKNHWFSMSFGWLERRWSGRKARRCFTRMRSQVRVLLSPPYMKNPNYFTIGSAFGFFVYIKDITYWCCSPEDFDHPLVFLLYPHIWSDGVFFLKWSQK